MSWPDSLWPDSSWIAYLVLGGVGLAAAALLSVVTIRWLGRREPYASFARLQLRRKLLFLRLLITDRRLPWTVRLLPILVLVYLVSPIDLVPGFALDDVAIALAALVIIVRLTPPELLSELLAVASDTGEPS